MYARGCYVVMTTNAGYDVIVKNRDKDNVRELFELALLDRFRPSFLNRFDEIAMFDHSPTLNTSTWPSCTLV